MNQKVEVLEKKPWRRAGGCWSFSRHADGILYMYAFTNHIQIQSRPCCVFILGADIADYFNYGFDEYSWNAYCRKQTELRRVKIKPKAKKKVRRWWWLINADLVFGLIFKAPKNKSEWKLRICYSRRGTLHMEERGLLLPQAEHLFQLSGQSSVSLLLHLCPRCCTLCPVPCCSSALRARRSWQLVVSVCLWHDNYLPDAICFLWS